jgi:hypothetical protein
MKWTPLLSGFLLNKNAFITTKRNSENSNIEVEIEKKPKRYGIQGYDERYLICYEDELLNMTETLLTIKKHLNQLALLNILECKHVSIYNKIKHIEEHEKTFGNESIAHNISAGGLWDDFNNVIDL